MNKNKSYNKNNPKTQKEESAALAKKFAGMVIITNTRNDTSHAKSIRTRKTTVRIAH